MKYLFFLLGLIFLISGAEDAPSCMDEAKDALAKQDPFCANNWDQQCEQEFEDLQQQYCGNEKDNTTEDQTQSDCNLQAEADVQNQDSWCDKTINQWDAACESLLKALTEQYCANEEDNN